MYGAVAVLCCPKTMKMYMIVMLVLGLSSPAVSAPAAGKVTGQMMVNGTAYKLTHVYARAVPDPFDERGVDIQVILSDVAISAEDRASEENREKLATAGKLHAMELLLGGDPIRPVFNDIYDAAFNGSQQPMRLTGLAKFETKTNNRKTIAGRHFMASAHNFGDMGNGVTF